MLTWPYLITSYGDKLITSQGNPSCFQADFIDKEFALCPFQYSQPNPLKQLPKEAKAKAIGKSLSSPLCCPVAFTL